ncbi:MAG: NapC/NirT family cytochrome c [Proteobacteria bacterium]|nr:NapC/NirT family cytochrome c [Pseudomonadota bacterium]
MLKRLFGLLPFLWDNWVSILGTLITTVFGNAMLVFTVVDLVGHGLNPYVATVTYLVMPPFFVGGLGLIALGAWRSRRRQREAPLRTAVASVLANQRARRTIAFVVMVTLVNVVLVSLTAYKAVSYSETSEFCGELCHTVMEPEHTAYLASPHARVSCAGCHIGEGASWFVKSKLSGVRQIWAVFAGSYSRPIATPIDNLRPARETCEHCHWPAKFHGVHLLRRDLFANDEANTRRTNVVMLNVGGINARTGRYEGIHWHVSPAVKVVYQALDHKRSKIGQVSVYEHGRLVRTFSPAGAAKASASTSAPGEARTMECIDCHNRPTHIFAASAAVAVDGALSARRIDAALPFVRRQAVALLAQVETPRAEAPGHFTSALQGFYRERYPQVAQAKAQAIAAAGAELGRLYQRNIFPAMRIRWGTYPSHLGHRQTSEGCFRCHDDEHKAADGRVIPQDCDLCHEVLAEEEEKPDVPEGLLRLAR